MNQRSFLIILSRTCLEVVAGDRTSIQRKLIPFEVESGPLSVCDELSRIMDELDYRGQDLCLALDSDKILSARIRCGDLPRRQRRSAMQYRFEEYLPLEVEQLTLAFMPVASSFCLGLAVETQPLERLLDELLKRQIEVTSICPVGLLALWSYIKQNNKTVDYVWLHRSRQNDLFVLSNSIPISWSSHPTVELTLQSLRVDLLTQHAGSKKQAMLVIGDIDPSLLSMLEEVLDVTHIPTDDDGFSSVLLAAAAQRTSGKSVGWVDFRVSHLKYRNRWSRMSKMLNAAVVMSIVFLISLTALFVVRAIEFNRLADEYDAKQSQQYRLLYPDRRVPENVNSRLKSEIVRLEGISGMVGDIPSQPNALETLRDLMAALPLPESPGGVFRLTDIQIGPQRVRLEGQTRTHTDAEVISRHIQRAGLEVDAPKSERLKGRGVSFSIDGRLKTGNSNR